MHDYTSREFPSLRRGAKEAPCLLRGSPRRGQAKHLLNILPDRHGAENIEEDEGAVSVILPQQVAMGQALDVGEGDKRKFCHHPAVKYGVEHAHEGSKAKANCKHGLHSNHRQVPVVVLQLLLLPLYFLFLLSAC